jgi:NADH-quinone oxidoreductase subunit N
MSADFLQIMKSEVSLTLIIFLLLFLKVWDGIKSNTTLLHIANVLLFINLIIGLFFNIDGELFSGMFYTNATLALEKSILNIGTLIISLQAFDWLKDHKHLLEFYILLLCTLLGMDFMISSGNFLMFYLGLELSSIPLAALCNYDLHKIKSSESAVKMILLSAFASCILLFGISMLYGTTGTLNFKEMAPLLEHSKLQVLAFIFIFSGFAFKLSAVPFHLWTADVYEGAPAPVTAYLSVISKGSVVFIFITVLFQLFHNYDAIWYNMLYLTILLSITIGNLFAIRQENIKRFLAFSSIAQVGYILLGISSGTSMGVSSAIFFLIVYTFSNLGAFGVVSLVSAKTGKENISDYKGFYKNNKYAAWVMAICLFSLGGIPPTAGFFGKMFLVTAGAAKGNYLLVSIAVMNMVISLFYYLRVVKAIFIDENEIPMVKLSGSRSLKLALVICVTGVVVTGFANGLFEFITTITGK